MVGYTVHDVIDSSGDRHDSRLQSQYVLWYNCKLLFSKNFQQKTIII